MSYTDKCAPGLFVQSNVMMTLQGVHFHLYIAKINMCFNVRLSECVLTFDSFSGLSH